MLAGESGCIPFTIIWNSGKVKSRWLRYFWAEVSSYVLLVHSLFTYRRYDVLWLYGMGFLPRLCLVSALHLLGKKVLFELNEFPYATEGNKLTRIVFFRKILTRLTLTVLLPKFDGVVVISENLKKVVGKYAPNVPILKIPILIDSHRVHTFGTEMDSPHPFPYIFHAGTVSVQKDGILKLVEGYAVAAQALKAKSFRLDLIFTSNQTFPENWAKIQKILLEYGVSSQFKVTGFLSQADLQQYLAHSIALIINKPESFQNKYNFPTKLGDYLISGRPVIVATAPGGEVKSYLTEKIDSLFVDPDDVNGLSDAIQLLVADSSYAQLIGHQGRKVAIQNFTYENNSAKIKDFILTFNSR